MGEPVRQPPYKSEKNVWFTASLFHDKWKLLVPEARFCDPVFTLYEDRPGLINFRKTFVELNDPTGYQWAIKYLGDWQHWLKLMKARWFVEAYEHAKRELFMKLKSEGVAKIQNLAASPDSKQALPAARYLAEIEQNLNKPVRGRPSNAEVQGELKNQVKLLEAEDEDMERIGLTVIEGGKSANGST